MEIREATAHDAAAVEALYTVLVSNPALSVDPARLEQIRTDPHNFLFVVEDGGVIGTVFLTICLDPMFGFAPYAVVENLVVSPNSRGRGLGSAPLMHAERVARERRCTKIMLLSTATRDDAHRFFARMAFDGDKKRAFVKYIGYPGTSTAGV